MKIGVVSIAPTLPAKHLGNFKAVYDAFGLNTGNYMFTQAMYRQLQGQVSQIGFYFDPKQVNESYDCIVIPAANWLKSNGSWDWLCDLLEKIEIPVVTIGLGVQAEHNDIKSISISPSSIRLAKIMSKKAAYISSRGSFTTSYLNSLGIFNVVSTGCPSIYMRIQYEEAQSSPINIAVQSTRYHFNPNLLGKNSINNDFFEYAAKYNYDMIYQSEAEEIQLLLNDRSEWEKILPAESRLHELYGLSSRGNFFEYLENHGRAFVNLEEWGGYLRQRDFVIGSRLHGAIIALNCGTPAVLFPHDSRTAEMADFAAIPTRRRPESYTRQFLEALVLPEDYARYEEVRTYNGRIYRQFLIANGLAPVEKALL